jgi:para-nitrobenzyl esterase
MQTIDVRVAEGTLRGELLDGRAVFRNVPFAAAPFGANRFRPPQPVARWDGVRDATAPTVAVPQPTMPEDLADTVFPQPDQDEDCLVLEVHTPEVRGGGLPVMVWIHGGGFIGGSGGYALHDGGTFARDGIVHVSINYRLHLEGFLYLGPGTGNLGLLDQVAALEWVQENIAAFGGDPGNVTVYGQSAGALSVVHLLTMPRAQGLFRRAISQSGSSEGAEPVEVAERFARHFAGMLGVAPTVDGFSAVPTERVSPAVLQYALEYLVPALWGAHSFMVSPFRPVLDGEVLTQAPVPAALAGVGAGVDLLAGSTRDECTFAMAPFGLLAELNEPWAAMALDAFGVTWDDLEAYRKGSRPDADPVELVMAAWTDWAFRIPTIRLAEARSQQAASRPTWLYEFTWPSPTLPEQRSSHSFEIPFVMDRLADVHAASSAAIDFLGPNAPQALADEMHRAWVRFATDGDPGWAPYEPEHRTTMRFDADRGPVDDLAGPAERELWEGRR